jgi:hypothetical protein
VDPEETSIATEQLGLQVSTATDTQPTTEELLGTIFSIRFVQNDYKEEFSSESAHTRVEAGSNTSTVTLRVVGDEKGSLKCETVKYGHEFYGTRTRK